MYIFLAGTCKKKIRPIKLTFILINYLNFLIYVYILNLYFQQVLEVFFCNKIIYIYILINNTFNLHLHCL